MRTARRRVTPADVEAYERELAAELPGFAVAYKDESRVQRVLARLLWPFNRHYLTGYTTVMFGRVYFPSRAWREAAGAERIYKTLRHEAVHLRDARRFPLLFQLTYLFVLPSVLTLRALWEWRAYAETLRVEHELHGPIPDRLLDDITARFVGPDYLFMCPFPRFVRRRLEALRRRQAGESTPTP
jgi:hypothetical protein